METRKATPISADDIEGLTVLAPSANALPIMEGKGIMSILCPSCDRVLIASINPDQITNIVLKCVCGTMGKI